MSSWLPKAPSRALQERRGNAAMVTRRDAQIAELQTENAALRARIRAFEGEVSPMSEQSTEKILSEADVEDYRRLGAPPALVHSHERQRARIAALERVQEAASCAEGIALQAWHDWRKTLAVDRGFTHPDGLKFVQILEQRFAPLRAAIAAIRPPGAGVTMPTVKDTILAMAEASDAGNRKVGFYRPAILKATRLKNGDVQITLGLVTNDLTVEDVMHGLVAWLAIGTVDAVQALTRSPGQEE